MTGPQPKEWRPVSIGVCLRRRRETIDPGAQPDRRFNFVGLEDVEGEGLGGIAMKDTAGSEILSLKTHFHEGDILYGKLRPYLNKVAVAPSEGVCSTDIWAFEPSSLIDRHYAYLVLSSPALVGRVSQLTRGANLPRIDASTFDSIEIPLPPLSEQRRIVEIMQEAEAVRRLRVEAAHKTADLIPAIFHDMFGDPLLNQRGWPTGALGGMGELDRGRSRHRPRDEASLYGGPYPFVQTGDVEGADGWIEVFNQTYSEAGLAQSRLWPKGTLCITIAANIGATAILSFDACFPDSIVGFTPGSQVTVEYVKWCLDVFRQGIEARAHDGAQKNINLKTLRPLQIPLPPKELQDAFAHRVHAVRDLNSVKMTASPLMDSLRGSLLTNAFTGDLTAGWRERRNVELEREAAERDVALHGAGVMLRKLSAPEPRPETAEDPRLSDLTPQQSGLVNDLRELWKDEELEAFTVESLALLIKNPELRHNPDLIRRNLDVLAARGFILRLTREQKQKTSDRDAFAVLYRRVRLARDAYAPGASPDMEAEVDDARGDALNRLAARLKERLS